MRYHSKVLIDKLANDATLQTLRGDSGTNKVFINKAPQKTIPPFQIVSLNEVEPSMHKDGVSQVDDCFASVSCFAQTYKDTEAIAARTRSILDGLSETISGVNVEYIDFLRQDDDHNAQANLQEVVQEYQLRVKTLATPEQLGSSLLTWMNPKQASTVDYRMMDTLTDNKGTKGSIFTTSADYGLKPRVNAKNFKLGLDSFITVASSTTEYQFLHDGSTWEFWGNVYFETQDLGDMARVILDTGGFQSSNVGLAIWLENRTAEGLSRGLRVLMVNGTSAVYNISEDTFFTENDWTRLRITHDGGNLNIYKNDTLVSTTAAGGSFSSSASTSDLKIGQRADSNVHDQMDVNLSDLIITKALTQSQINTMEYYMRSLDQSKEGDSNLYILWGQSNITGGNLNTADPLDKDIAGSPVMYGITSSYTSATEGDRNFSNVYGFKELTYQVNNEASYLKTHDTHGPEFSFLKKITRDSPYPVMCLKWGRSGTRLVGYTASAVWQIGDVNSHYDRDMTKAIKRWIYEIRRGLWMNPIVRGLTVTQGIGDAQYTGAGDLQTDFQTELENIIKAVVDDVENDGFTSVSKMRVWIALTHNNDPSQVKGNEVRAAQQATADNFRTNHPTYANKVLGLTTQNTNAYTLLADNVHWNETGQQTHGTDNYNYFKQFVRE